MWLWQFRAMLCSCLTAQPIRKTLLCPECAGVVIPAYEQAKRILLPLLMHQWRCYHVLMARIPEWHLMYDSMFERYLKVSETPLEKCVPYVHQIWGVPHICKFSFCFARWQDGSGTEMSESSNSQDRWVSVKPATRQGNSGSLQLRAGLPRLCWEHSGWSDNLKLESSESILWTEHFLRKAISESGFKSFRLPDHTKTPEKSFSNLRKGFNNLPCLIAWPMAPENFLTSSF